MTWRTGAVSETTTVQLRAGASSRNQHSTKGFVVLAAHRHAILGIAFVVHAGLQRVTRRQFHAGARGVEPDLVRALVVLDHRVYQQQLHWLRGGHADVGRLNDIGFAPGFAGFDALAGEDVAAGAYEVVARAAAQGVAAFAACDQVVAAAIEDAHIRVRGHRVGFDCIAVVDPVVNG